MKQFGPGKKRRQDTQHNDIPHNITQNNNTALRITILHITRLRITFRTTTQKTPSIAVFEMKTLGVTTTLNKSTSLHIFLQI
jgi:hypothetical protein